MRGKISLGGRGGCGRVVFSFQIFFGKMNWRFRVSLNQRGGNMIVHGKQYLQNTEINGVEFADDLYAGFFFLLFFFREVCNLSVCSLPASICSSRSPRSESNVDKSKRDNCPNRYVRVMRTLELLCKAQHPSTLSDSNSLKLPHLKIHVAAFYLFSLIVKAH